MISISPKPRFLPPKIESFYDFNAMTAAVRHVFCPLFMVGAPDVEDDVSRES